MKCQAVLLLLGIACTATLRAADPHTEVREIRRLLQSRGQALDARALKALKGGRAEDLAQLRRQIQHSPLPAAKNIGQGTGKAPSPRGSKLSARGKLHAPARKL